MIHPTMQLFQVLEQVLSLYGFSSPFVVPAYSRSRWRSGGVPDHALLAIYYYTLSVILYNDLPVDLESICTTLDLTPPPCPLKDMPCGANLS